MIWLLKKNLTINLLKPTLLKLLKKKPQMIIKYLFRVFLSYPLKRTKHQIPSLTAHSISTNLYQISHYANQKQDQDVKVLKNVWTMNHPLLTTNVWFLNQGIDIKDAKEAKATSSITYCTKRYVQISLLLWNWYYAKAESRIYKSVVHCLKIVKSPGLNYNQKMKFKRIFPFLKW